MLASIAVLAVLIYVLIKFIAGRLHNDGIAEPPAWPLLRHMPYFWKQDHAKTCSKIWQLMKGRDIFRCDMLDAFDSDAIVPRDLSTIKTMFSDDSTFLTRADLVQFFPALEKSITNLNGSIHRTHRMIVSKAFTPETLRTYVPLFNKYSQQLCQTLQGDIDQNGSEIVHVQDYMRNFAMNVICDAGLGCKGDAKERQEVEQLLLLLNQENLAYPNRMVLKYIGPIFNILPFGPAHNIRRRGYLADNFLEKQIDKRVEELQLDPSKAEQAKTFLDLLLVDTGRENGLTKDEIKGNLMFFLMAGHDTTAVALAWNLYALALYPEYQPIIREEIEEVVGEDEEISYNHLMKMNKLNNFIRESIRVFPPVSFNNRVVAQDCQFGDYNLRKGTKVQLWTTAIHGDERFYADAEKFNPSRFEGNATVKRGSYVAFSLGPHACLGERFAMLEMKVALMHLVRHFDISEDPKFVDYKCDYPFTRIVQPHLSVKLARIT